jgi:hypothetical protein
MKVGMPDRAIIRQFAHEFSTIIGDWGLCLGVTYQRDATGTIIHQTVNNRDPNDPGFDLLLEPIPRIQEDVERGTEIVLRIDQLGVLDYWAQAGQEALVGVSFQINGHAVEYWLPMTIDPSPNEGNWDSYLKQLKGKWREKLGNISPCVY